MVKGLIKACLLSCLLFIGCKLNGEEIMVFSYSFEFSTLDHDWTGDFADYPEEDSVFYELEFKHDLLPPNLSATRKALKISGNNHSDDLFMFIKRKLTGLRPNATYKVLFNVRFASNVPVGTVGVGGSPGESVYVKAGATAIEPKKVLTEGFYLMNIDKGNQSEGGTDMQVIGNVAVAANTTQYTEVYRNNSSISPFQVKANNQGEVWVIVGTDSGFESTTTLYYTSVDIMLSQVD